jgi:hypothetical protein
MSKITFVLDADLLREVKVIVIAAQYDTSLKSYPEDIEISYTQKRRF